MPNEIDSTQLVEGVRLEDLQLADIVRFGDDPFSDGIVYRIENGIVYVRRPYMTHADFRYTGGVIPYVGIEDVALSCGSATRVRVLRCGPKLR